MQHPKSYEWDERLRTVLISVDAEMEKRHGKQFSLHPRRPPEGTTATPQMDGLFEVDASFSPGFGSAYGRGYVVDVRVATLDEVPAGLRQQWEEEAVALLRKGLAEVFPERSLSVVRDGPVFKIIGDFKLGIV